MDNSGHVVKPESTSEACMRCVRDVNKPGELTSAAIPCKWKPNNRSLGMPTFAAFSRCDECHFAISPA